MFLGFLKVSAKSVKTKYLYIAIQDNLLQQNKVTLKVKPKWRAKFQDQKESLRMPIVYPHPYYDFK